MEKYMIMNSYQAAARETAVYPADMGVVYTTLGLNGEAGEIADKVKKVLRDNDGEMSLETQDEIMRELGDVLWYVAMLAWELGYNLGDIASANIAKLTDRKNREVLNGSGDKR